MESFKLIETFSYFDDDGVEVVSLADAIYCMKILLGETTIKKPHNKKELIYGPNKTNKKEDNG